jgi:hypothetical protein
MPIKTCTLTMMDTGSGQMGDPPHGHTQRQQQPIEPLQVGNQAGFEIPATAFGVLEGGFHSHAQRILVHAPSACRQIGDQEPGFSMLLIPDGARGAVSSVSSSQSKTCPNHC